MKSISLILIFACGICFAQNPAGAKPPVKGQTQQQKADAEQQRKRNDIMQAEKEGIDVRLKGIAHFRGIRGNQLMGTGLVVGLGGSGDTKKSIITQQIMSNMFKEFGIKLEPSLLDMKNVAAVMVTAELPPFSSNGQLVDVQVQSIGDAKSLVGGTLLQTAMYAAGDQSTVYVMAQGSLDVGGYDVSSGGTSAKKNFVTAGRVPEGGIVERGASTKLVYDGKMYLDLNQPDITTAGRVASKINENYPNLNATATNGATIELTLPDGVSAVDAMSRIEELHVMADTLETIVINEKTGTIVIGGNVRIGPAAIVHGSLSVRIDQDIRIVQPNPFSLGQTGVEQKTTINVDEPKADVASLAPNTTVADLAKVFHALQLKASDVIAILQALREQGALKARIISQ
jgi:flagellar P-ring protein precursor FlgI